VTSETIQLRTEGGQTIEVEVLSLHPDRIEVLIGESMRCVLTPTRNKLAYAGSVRGRELVYEKSPNQVRAELMKQAKNRRGFR